MESLAPSISPLPEFFFLDGFLSKILLRGRRGLDRMVVGFTTTYAIGAYHH
jgi:hypothetical protein